MEATCSANAVDSDGRAAYDPIFDPFEPERHLMCGEGEKSEKFQLIPLAV